MYCSGSHLGFITDQNWHTMYCSAYHQEFPIRTKKKYVKETTQGTFTSYKIQNHSAAFEQYDFRP